MLACSVGLVGLVWFFCVTFLAVLAVDQAGLELRSSVFPSAGIKGVCHCTLVHHAQLFMLILGFKLWSSSLGGKHSTN